MVVWLPDLVSKSWRQVLLFLFNFGCIYNYFLKFQFLDLRFTPLNDSDLQCFNAIQTLKEILVDCPKELNKTEVKEEDKQLECFDETPEKLNGTEFKRLADESSIKIVQFRNNAAAGAAIAAAGSEEHMVDDGEVPSTSAGTSATTKRSQANGSSESVSPFKVKISISSANSVPTASATNADGMETESRNGDANLEDLSNSSSSSSASSSPAAARAQSIQPEEQAPANNANTAENNPINWPAAGGNIPAHSRFLPRPDQVIYLDLHNRRRAIIMHGPPRRPPNADAVNNIDHVMNHPLFYDMINPLRRREDYDQEYGPFGVEFAAARGQRRARFVLQHYQASQRSHGISDRGLCAFGRGPQNNMELGMVWIRMGGGPEQVDNNFERITVRNYKLVTDSSLRHLVQCSPNLVYLDLSGTSVTLEGVQSFKLQKPTCHVVAEHLIDSMAS